MTTLPCAAFEDAFAAVREGRAGLAMLPIENSVAGRVADIHHLMPDSGLFIIAEHFERVRHHLLALPGARLDQIRTVRSHVHALSQCRTFIRSQGLQPVVRADTAGSAGEVKELGDPTIAAIASNWPARSTPHLAKETSRTPSTTRRASSSCRRSRSLRRAAGRA